MKKLTLTLCAVAALVSAAYAGPERYSGKEMKQAVEQPAPCPTWYADNEWNLTISGVYAATINDHNEDTYLGDDHSWGGAIDAKYFFRRYMGLGLQGFGLVTDNSHNNDGFRTDSDGFVGGVLGTFTFRYPIPCSRFAPYVWLGGGAIFGGGSFGRGVGRGDVAPGDDEVDDFFTSGDSDDARLMAQYGAGFEVRFTPRIGWTNDVSFNHVEGGFNDFLQFRTGLNFAF